MKQKLLSLLFLLTGVAQPTLAQKVAYATINEPTLTFYYDDQKASRENVIEISDIATYSNYISITSVVIDNSVAGYHPTSTASWFKGLKTMTTIVGIENLNTEEVTDMSQMFYNCSALANLDVSRFNTSKVTNMGKMFQDCSSLTTLDVSNFDTSNVTDMGGLFRGCSSLKSIDVSHFNTANATEIWGMFYGCSSLTSIDVSNFNTSKAWSLNHMFDGCSSLTTLDVSSFDTSNVTIMGGVFRNCSALSSIDLSNFNTSNVTDMDVLFRGCTSLSCIYVDEEKWNLTKVYSANTMFMDCTNLVGGNGTTYDESHTGLEYARIDKPGQPGYLTQKTSSGIKTIQHSAITADYYYTLDGRRTSEQPTKSGLYIIGGKKVVVK